MTTKDDLLKARFLLNMRRIGSLVQLLSSHGALKPAQLFRSEGARADILRVIVVFLHATFEVVLRSHIPRSNRNLSFYSRVDLEKALRQSDIDAKPFRPLFAPLTQMAKRRKQIVHDADLSAPTAVVSEVWGASDDWQLIMWLMAVSAFYYQLRISTHAASPVERAMSERLRAAMLTHIDFGKQLIALPTLPPEQQAEGLRKLVALLEEIMATLNLDASDFIASGATPDTLV